MPVVSLSNHTNCVLIYKYTNGLLSKVRDLYIRIFEHYLYIRDHFMPA